MTSHRERKAQWAFDMQVKQFTERFGRPPREGESIWYDPDEPGDEPVPLTEERFKQDLMVAMFEAGTPGHLIYAWEKAGLILDDEGYKLADADTQIEWDDTVREFFAMTRQQRRTWERQLREVATKIRGKSGGKNTDR